MKLSEAILKGCEITTPFKHGYFSQVNDKFCACAMGAAAIGVNPNGLKDEDVRYDTLDTIFENFSNTLYKTKFKNPVSGMEQDGLALVINLNDSHDWPREKIANWLAEQGH